MLEIRTHKSDEISKTQLAAVNVIAARGFGHVDTAGMLDDTRAHVSHADTVQIAYSNEQPAAFALYKERLWR